MAQRERLDDGSVHHYKNERVTLAEGETLPAAGTSKKQWVGPGTFRRVTWPDGGRDDHEETATLGYIPD